MTVRKIRVHRYTRSTIDLLLEVPLGTDIEEKAEEIEKFALSVFPKQVWKHEIAGDALVIEIEDEVDKNEINCCVPNLFDILSNNENNVNQSNEINENELDLKRSEGEIKMDELEVTSTETVTETVEAAPPVVVKRGRGRPKGSKNKPKPPKTETPAVEATPEL